MYKMHFQPVLDWNFDLPSFLVCLLRSAFGMQIYIAFADRFLLLVPLLLLVAITLYYLSYI